jgi:hypothetical protein
MNTIMGAIAALFVWVSNPITPSEPVCSFNYRVLGHTVAGRLNCNNPTGWDLYSASIFSSEAPIGGRLASSDGPTNTTLVIDLTDRQFNYGHLVLKSRKPID